MNIDFTPDNALELVILISPLLPIIATYLIAQVDWKSEWKIGVAFLASFLIAGLTAYGEGNFQENFWSNLFYTFTAAQGIYAVVFKSLGLEARIKPVEAVASEAAQSARQQISTMDSDDARNVLDKSSPDRVDVTTTVTH